MKSFNQIWRLLLQIGGVSLVWGAVGAQILGTISIYQVIVFWALGILLVHHADYKSEEELLDKIEDRTSSCDCEVRLQVDNCDSNAKGDSNKNEKTDEVIE